MSAWLFPEHDDDANVAAAGAAGAVAAVAGMSPA